jgi:hypothetical protein
MVKKKIDLLMRKYYVYLFDLEEGYRINWQFLSGHPNSRLFKINEREQKWQRKK